MLVRKMRQFHRLKYSVDDHGRPEPGAEAQKEHAAALVASQCLHGSIIDHLNRTAECLAEVESDPAAAKVVGLVDRASMNYRTWIADRHAVIFPILGDTLHISHHHAGGHLGTGWNLALLALSGCQHLDVRSSDIDHQDRNWPSWMAGSHGFFST